MSLSSFSGVGFSLKDIHVDLIDLIEVPTSNLYVSRQKWNCSVVISIPIALYSLNYF